MTQDKDIINNDLLNSDAIDINSYGDIPGTTHLSNPLHTDAEITEKLTEELQEQKDKFLRQAAEFENFKRRSSKERIELIQTAGKDIIVSLLDVVDDFDRAEKQIMGSDDLEQIKAGTALVFNKLRVVLQGKGLKSMESIGEVFDVEKHEAITEVPVDEAQQGKVIDEVQKGYYLNDKLIRFAKVVVGK